METSVDVVVVRVVVTSIVVDDGHKVVANVTFLLGALWVTLPENKWCSLRRHQYKRFHSNLLGIIVAT